MVMKLDMSKVYDKVEWAYLQAIMGKLDFAAGWIDLVIRYISSVSCEILVNGYPGRTFEPQRGLRQRDPLSPYLFVLCVEGLSTLLDNAEEQNVFFGIRITKLAPKVLHLFFADDSIIFSRASEEDCGRIGFYTY